MRKTTVEYGPETYRTASPDSAARPLGRGESHSPAAAISIPEARKIGGLTTIQWTAILLLSAALSLYLWSPGLRAEWGIIDDHEIQAFIGTHQRMPLSQFVPQLRTTEVRQPGRALRYRPGYYALRLIECMLWGKSPAAWYGFRLVLFFAAFALMIALLARYVGLMLAVAVCVVMLCHGFWSGIFARLGPSEVYAVIGLPLYVLAFLEIRRLLAASQAVSGGPRRWTLWLWALTLGLATFLTAGAKENFTLVAIPSLYLLFLAIRSRLHRGHPGIGPLAILCGNAAFPILIMAAVVRAIARSGHDVYNNPVGLGQRLMLLAAGLPLHALLATGALLAISIAIACAAIASRRVESNRLYSRPPTQATLVQATLLILFLTQIFFYNGKWPTGTRYDFPGLLIPEISMVLAVKSFSDLVSPRPAQTLRIGAVLLLCGFALIFHARIQAHRQVGEENVARTREFTTRIQRIVNEVSTNPRRPIVLESHEVLDYEPIFSTRTFLRFAGVTNPIQLDILGYSSKAFPPESLARRLSEQMEGISQRGDRGSGLTAYQPGLADVFTVGLSGEPTGPPHHPTVRVY